ncbi:MULTISPECIES: hypothetical protein [Paenibacillus]|uniref:hypothetical protein n=1 Tax=Paenibacillus TaxID=44249 RepID=UPI000DA634A2|nr:hypothetical protein [Paenibacillus bouchesdurhonensis]
MKDRFYLIIALCTFITGSFFSLLLNFLTVIVYESQPNKYLFPFLALPFYLRLLEIGYVALIIIFLVKYNRSKSEK